MSIAVHYTRGLRTPTGPRQGKNAVNLTTGMRERDLLLRTCRLADSFREKLEDGLLLGT